MTKKDLEALDIHKNAFRQELERYSIAGFVFKTFLDNIENWQIVF